MPNHDRRLYETGLFGDRKMRNSWSLTRWIFGVALVAVLPGLAAAQEPVKVRIGLASASLGAAAPRIAQRLGLFEKHGLDAKITILDDSSIATQALISGSVDFSGTAPSDAIIAQTRGQAVVAVTTLYGGYSPAIVLSKKVADGTGVAPTAPVRDRLKALDGILMGSTSAISNFTLGVKCALESAGATVRFTYMSQPAMVTALEAGVVQAFIASAPFYAIPAEKGSGVIWVSGPDGEFPAGCATTYAATLNTTRGYAQANPEAIKRIRAVFADFADAVRKRPDDVKTAISQLFPDMSPAILAIVMKSQSETSGYGAAPPNAEGIAREINFVKMSGASLPGLDKIDPASLLVP